MLPNNAAFTSEYLSRVLDEFPEGSGIALRTPISVPVGKGMSNDDVVAERDRLGSVVRGRTPLPVVGLT